MTKGMAVFTLSGWQAGCHHVLLAAADNSIVQLVPRSSGGKAVSRCPLSVDRRDGGTCSLGGGLDMGAFLLHPT